MEPVASHPTSLSADERDWRWRATRLAHEIERTAEIKRARGAELDPLDERLVELTRQMVGPLH